MELITSEFSRSTHEEGGLTWCPFRPADRQGSFFFWFQNECFLCGEDCFIHEGSAVTFQDWKMLQQWFSLPDVVRVPMLLLKSSH